MAGLEYLQVNPPQYRHDLPLTEKRYSVPGVSALNVHFKGRAVF